MSFFRLSFGLGHISRGTILIPERYRMFRYEMWICTFVFVFFGVCSVVINTIISTTLNPTSIVLPVPVRGLCCPLLQRPSSGRTTNRVTLQSGRGGDGRLRRVTSAKGRLVSRTEPGSPAGSSPTVCHRRDQGRETAGDAITHVHTPDGRFYCTAGRIITGRFLRSQKK